MEGGRKRDKVYKKRVAALKVTRVDSPLNGGQMIMYKNERAQLNFSPSSVSSVAGGNMERLHSDSAKERPQFASMHRCRTN